MSELLRHNYTAPPCKVKHTRHKIGSCKPRSCASQQNFQKISCMSFLASTE